MCADLNEASNQLFFVKTIGLAAGRSVLVNLISGFEKKKPYFSKGQ